MSDLSAAVMVFNVGWACTFDKIKLQDGLFIESLVTSKISPLYEQICLEKGIHYGDPFTDGIVIEMNSSWLDIGFWSYHTPASHISTICNCISIFLSSPLPQYTLLYSNDDFDSIHELPIDLNNNYDLYEFLSAHIDNYSQKINDSLSKCGRKMEIEYFVGDKLIGNIITTLENLRKFGSNSKIQNSFSYYFNAWRAYQIEHTCINLSIILESLFSPAGNSELNHQISFYTTQFLGGTPEEKQEIFKIVKKFYSLRSKIVHGSLASTDDLSVTVPVMFMLCSEILQKLLTDKNLLDTFSNNEKRATLFRSWLF